MHKTYLILLLILTCSCTSTEQRISEFENTLGERQTNALNLLVADFEKNLKNIYPDMSIEKAYQHYLSEIISDSITDWGKFKFQSEKTNSEFHQSGLWREIYIKDPVRGLQVNATGKYMQALYPIRDSDSLINVYWDRREASGLVQNEIVVHGILSSHPDFSNYFHKRIVVVELSY